MNPSCFIKSPRDILCELLMIYDWSEIIYSTIVFRCILFYFILVASLRVMGKREIGELSIFDLVIFLVMSELLALVISDSTQSLLTGLLPMITLTILQVFLSFIILKNKQLRDVLDGKPVCIIYEGVVQQKVMKKQRYSIDDLFAQLRINGQHDLSMIRYAILENNGSLSIVTKGQRICYPYPLIQDGEVNHSALIELHKDVDWLSQKLSELGYCHIYDIFICLYEEKGLFVIEKEC